MGIMYVNHVLYAIVYLTRLVYSALPYSLKMSECQHAFCALCLLQWIFKDFCDGVSQSPIHCPSCMTSIPNFPVETPRDPATFPLVHNHVAHMILHAYTGVLTDAANEILYDFDDVKQPVANEASLAWGWDMPALQGLHRRER